MRIQSLRRGDAKYIFLAVEGDCPRLFVAGVGVDQNQRTEAGDLMRQVECWSSEIDKSHVVSEVVLRLENPQDVRTDAVVSQQDIADSADERSCHRIFAT